MLNYHFGSREGLLEAIVTRQLERAREVDASLFDYASDVDGLDARWAQGSTDDERAFDRLFFELVAIAARGGSSTERFRNDYVEPWLALSEQAARRFGLDADATRSLTRLDVAVLVGLALDRLLTDDDAGVDAAYRTYAELRRPTVERARTIARTGGDG